MFDMILCRMQYSYQTDNLYYARFKKKIFYIISSSCKSVFFEITDNLDNSSIFFYIKKRGSRINAIDFILNNALKQSKTLRINEAHWYICSPDEQLTQTHYQIAMTNSNQCKRTSKASKVTISVVKRQFFNQFFFNECLRK